VALSIITERVPTRFDPTDEQVRALPHDVLMGAAICGFDREHVKIVPRNPAAREIFRRLLQWEQEHGLEKMP
jgi:hypothetical protein